MECLKNTSTLKVMRAGVLVPGIRAIPAPAPAGVCPHRHERRACSTTSATASSVSSEVTASPPDAADFEAVCPICCQTKFNLKSFAQRRSQPRLFCQRCGRSYVSDELYTDLTLESLPGAEYKETYWGGTQIFRSPVVSWLYERGWRQNFSGFGFPGVEEETRIALDYMKPAWGETVMDLSCGSGLFSRQFIKSGKFKNVIVSDFSENMLKQSSKFIAEDPSLDPSKYTLLRLDAGRLPFETGSLAAIHAGKVAEISRVLRPGGVFVASTILNPSSGLGSIVGDDTIRPFKQLGAFRFLDDNVTGAWWKWFDEGALRDICANSGLKLWASQRDRWFILFRVAKPVA